MSILLRNIRRVLAAIVFFALFTTGAVRSSETLTLVYPGERNGFWGRLADDLSKAVESQGIVVDRFPDSDLGGSERALDAVLGSVVEMAFVNGYHLAKKVRGFEVLNLPLLAADLSEAQNIISAIGPELAEQAAREGLKVLGYTWVVGTFVSAGGCVVRPEDIKGARVIDGPPLHQRLIEHVGAVAVPLQFAEYYSALQTGIAGKGLFPIPLILEANFQETTDCITDPSGAAVMLVPVVLIMNKDRFDEQPVESAAAIEQSATDMEKEAATRTMELASMAVDAYREVGNSAKRIEGESLSAWRDSADSLNKQLSEELGVQDLYTKALDARNEK